MHINAVKLVQEILPVSHIVIEKVSFDFQKLENQNIHAWQYGKGILYGFKDYKDYINAEQNGICLLCGKNHIEYYHHIIQKKDGGSDNVNNIAGLCYNCHYGNDGVHKNPEAQEQLKSLKEGLKQKYKIGLLNSVMPLLIEEFDAYSKTNHISFSVIDGYATSQIRKQHILPKEHCIDAYCISINNRNCKTNFFPSIIYEQQRFKKKSKNIIHKRNNREYYFKNGDKLVLVAKNRHKATGQEFPSLEEHLSDYAKSHTEYECITYAKNLVVKPCRRSYTYHKNKEVFPIHTGDVVKYEKRNKTNGNIKTEIFVADRIDLCNNVVRFGTKSKKVKFCRTIKSGSIHYIDNRTLII